MDDSYLKCALSVARTGGKPKLFCPICGCPFTIDKRTMKKRYCSPRCRSRGTALKKKQEAENNA